jgi:hypothetical protein
MNPLLLIFLGLLGLLGVLVLRRREFNRRGQCVLCGAPCDPDEDYCQHHQTKEL